MSFFSSLAYYVAQEVSTEIAERITDEVVLLIRQYNRIHEMDKEADALKMELAHAESNAEREAVLEKVYDLINGFKRV